MRKTLVTIIAAAILPGCATIFSGTTQDVAIKTTPGANYKVTNTYGETVAEGVSPGTATIKRGASYFSPHAYTVKMTKDGYSEKTVPLDPSLNGWYFANIILGGFLGMIIVDPLTGGMYRFLPAEVTASLDEKTEKPAQ